LRGKKSPDRRFFGILHAKRNKLLGKILRILLFLSGCCSENEVSEQLYYNMVKAGEVKNFPHLRGKREFG
jgi:hypothetical protein